MNWRSKRSSSSNTKRESTAITTQTSPSGTTSTLSHRWNHKTRSASEVTNSNTISKSQLTMVSSKANTTLSKWEVTSEMIDILRYLLHQISFFRRVTKAQSRPTVNLQLITTTPVITMLSRTNPCWASTGVDSNSIIKIIFLNRFSITGGPSTNLATHP